MSRASDISGGVFTLMLSQFCSPSGSLCAATQGAALIPLSLGSPLEAVLAWEIE